MSLLKFKPNPYQKMYSTLFNAITDALWLLENKNSAEAIALLKQAQQSTEEQYIEAEGGAPPQRWNNRSTRPGAGCGPHVSTVPGHGSASENRGEYIPAPRAGTVRLFPV